MNPLPIGLFIATVLLAMTTFPAYVSNDPSDANDVEVIGVFLAIIFLLTAVVFYLLPPRLAVHKWWAASAVAGVGGYMTVGLALLVEDGNMVEYHSAATVAMVGLLVSFVLVGKPREMA